MVDNNFYIFRTVHHVVYIWERPTRCTLYFLYLFKLYYPLHVSNKQIHHQEVTSVHTAHVHD